MNSANQIWSNDGLCVTLGTNRTSPDRATWRDAAKQYHDADIEVRLYRAAKRRDCLSAKFCRWLSERLSH
jgi:hypothetical protein